MNGSLKKSSKILYGVCSCIIVLMVICYFGVSNTKGTYSATICYACTNGGSTFYSTSKIPGVNCTQTDNSKCQSSSSSSSSSSQSCCVKNGFYDNKTSCQSSTNRECKAHTGSLCGGGCWIKTNVGLSCSDTSKTQSACESATKYKCTQDIGTGCWLTTGESLCSTGNYYENGQSQCQNETGYVCQCGYGSNACCVKTSQKLGGGVDCMTGNTTGSCGDKIIEVCTISGTYQCKSTNGSSYSYTCTHDSGSQTAADGSWSTCTLSAQLSSSVTLTFMNGSTKVKSQSCTIPSGASRCSSDIIAPGAQTKTGDTTGKYKFNGWGEKDGCETGSYTANAAFAPSVSKTYYACYRKSSNDVTSSDFDSSKCTYSSLYTVTRDERYLNCKYTNITYNNSATENIAGNVSACCRNKGYTWVAENFTSSGYGNEYCIVCGSTPGGGPNPPSSSSSSKPSSSSSSSKPSSISTTLSSSSSNVDDNPKTGSVAIFMVWVIALGTLIYSFVYFKQSKFE